MNFMIIPYYNILLMSFFLSLLACSAPSGRDRLHLLPSCSVSWRFHPDCSCNPFQVIRSPWLKAVLCFAVISINTLVHLVFVLAVDLPTLQELSTRRRCPLLHFYIDFSVPQTISQKSPTAEFNSSLINFRFL